MQAGQEVEKGDILMTVEGMKMEVCGVAMFVGEAVRL